MNPVDHCPSHLPKESNPRPQFFLSRLHPRLANLAPRDFALKLFYFELLGRHRVRVEASMGGTDNGTPLSMILE
ncbi:MAG: hypothetical protein AB7N71_01015 [Phycisphaerae bacterium]